MGGCGGIRDREGERKLIKRKWFDGSGGGGRTTTTLQSTFDMLKSAVTSYSWISKYWPSTNFTFCSRSQITQILLSFNISLESQIIEIWMSLRTYGKLTVPVPTLDQKDRGGGIPFLSIWWYCLTFSVTNGFLGKKIVFERERKRDFFTLFSAQMLLNGPFLLPI